MCSFIIYSQGGRRGQTADNSGETGIVGGLEGDLEEDLEGDLEGELEGDRFSVFHSNCN